MKNHLFMSAMIAIPLSPADWQSVSYDDIPANKLGEGQKYLEMMIDRSASPLVYKLDSKKKVESLEFQASMEGQLNYGELLPGQEGADDFPLRVGLVVAGEKSLNRFQKWLASDWVLKLHALGDENSGIDHVLFLNVTSQKKASFQKRTHPLSELFRERVVGEFKDGKVHVSYKLEKPQPVLGLWISSDGDDTGSKYKVKIHQLSLKTQNE